jgi:protein tyrosine phosphatase type IVA
MSFINPPSIIVYNGLTCIISDTPCDSNIDSYLKCFTKYNVKHLVYVCQLLYNPEPFIKSGIQMHNLEFPDGSNPSPHTIKRWHQIVSDAISTNTAIAVHCIAGLGRAPVLVGIALIDQGISALETIEYIRNNRKGSLNAHQLKFLLHYGKNYSHRNGCIVS